MIAQEMHTNFMLTGCTVPNSKHLAKTLFSVFNLWMPLAFPPTILGSRETRLSVLVRPSPLWSAIPFHPA